MKKPTKEIKILFRQHEHSYTIYYCLFCKEAVMQFVVRCPTPVWNYYLPIDLCYHASKPQYKGQCSTPCSLLKPDTNCYYAGSSTGANELWSKFVITGDEDIIWNERVSLYKAKLPENQ